MKNLVDSIFEKNFSDAELSLKEELASLVEKKLWEKKKMLMAADDKKKDKTILVTTKGDPKAKKGGGVKRIPASDYDEKVHNLAVEAVVHSDGLVHLTSGENVLPSVYRQRRWLAEASGGKAHLADQIDTIRSKLPKGHKAHKHLDMAEKAADEDDMEKAIEHTEHAAKMSRELKEQSAAGINQILKSAPPMVGPKPSPMTSPSTSAGVNQVLKSPAPMARSPMTGSSPVRPAIQSPNKSLFEIEDLLGLKSDQTKNDPTGKNIVHDKETEGILGGGAPSGTDPTSQLKDLQNRGSNEIDPKKKERDSQREQELKKQKEVAPELFKEDCGLSPEKEEKIHDALEKARLILHPQLNTTAPRIDRTKLSIPKGVRRGDRLSAPDLGPKEDEWMYGKKLEENTGFLNQALRQASKEGHTSDSLLNRKTKNIKPKKVFGGRKKLEEEQINEAATRKDFRLVADLIKNVPNEKKRKILAQHHADIFTSQNPRFDKKRFFDAAGVKHDE